MHTAVSGNPKAYSLQKSNYGDGWWNRHFGEEKMFDMNKFCVICFSHFGGNGPSSTADELCDYKLDLSILDTCYLSSLALEYMGISCIYAVIGVSMGAPIAREWMFQDKIKVKKIIEIFANFGNNYIGSIAKDYMHIQIDLLQYDGNNLLEIKKRLHKNCESMRQESKGYKIAYDHIMSEFDTLNENLSDCNILRVARMVGFIRFVTPHYFQQKWDGFFFEKQNEEFANEQLKKLCSHLGDVFVKTFKKSSLELLRCMDAKPNPVPTNELVRKITQKQVKVLGIIVRGDRLYNPDLQFDYYKDLQKSLADSDDCANNVKIHICHNHIRGHDHFLSEEFLVDAEEIRKFLIQE